MKLSGINFLDDDRITSMGAWTVDPKNKESVERMMSGLGGEDKLVYIVEVTYGKNLSCSRCGQHYE